MGVPGEPEGTAFLYVLVVNSQLLLDLAVHRPKLIGVVLSQL